MDKMRCFKITPSSRTDVDSTILRDEGNWGNVLAEVEQSLDRQWSEVKDCDREWGNLGVQVKCVEMTEEQFAELEE